VTGQTGGSGTGPVFLVGPARSGTSLLYKALCLHPDAGYVSNWVRAVPRLPELAVLNRIPRRLPALRRSVWFGSDSNAYVYGVKRSQLERLFPMPVEGEPLFRHCGLVQFDWEREAAPSTQRRALRRSFSSIRRSAGASVVINKRIANNRRIPQLLAAFPEARFVSIVRDGRAVAYSLSRVDWWEDDIVWWYGGTPRRWREEGGDPWEICARNWVEELAEIEHGLSDVPEAQKLEISYEGFVAAPVDVLADVAAFAGLDPSRGGWRSGLSQLSFPDRNEAWARRLEPDVIAQVEAIQRPALDRYGYVTTTPVEG
jgi:hypothetical protein